MWQTEHFLFITQTPPVAFDRQMCSSHGQNHLLPMSFSDVKVIELTRRSRYIPARQEIPTGLLYDAMTLRAARTLGMI